MTISPEDPADLNITFSGTSSTFDLETAQIRCDKKLTTEKLDMYNFKKLFRHYDSPPDCRFVQAQRKPRPNSDDIDRPAYFVIFAGEPCYSIMKGPHSRHHWEQWWNFIDREAATSRPEPHPYILGKINYLWIRKSWSCSEKHPTLPTTTIDEHRHSKSSTFFLLVLLRDPVPDRAVVRHILQPKLATCCHIWVCICSLNSKITFLH